MASDLGTLELAHQFIKAHVRAGDVCIDATCGRGRDTALLCELAGPAGKVLAFDIQPAAIVATKALLAARGYENAEVILTSHARMGEYAEAESVAAVMFNFGWLPGGDHNIFTLPESSLAALEQALRLLKPGGVVSMCIYYGRNNGYAERDALLAAVARLDPERFTVLRTEFVNRTGEPPIAVFIIKE